MLWKRLAFAAVFPATIVVVLLFYGAAADIVSLANSPLVLAMTLAWLAWATIADPLGMAAEKARREQSLDRCSCDAPCVNRTNVDRAVVDRDGPASIREYANSAR